MQNVKITRSVELSIGKMAGILCIPGRWHDCHVLHVFYFSRDWKKIPVNIPELQNLFLKILWTPVNVKRDASIW